MTTDKQASSSIEVFREWQRCIATNDQEGTARVVDMDGYTEICLGLTDWTTGYAVAFANYYRNMIAPWSDMTFREEDITESADGVTVRLRVEAIHSHDFLGVPARPPHHLGPRQHSQGQGWPRHRPVGPAGPLGDLPAAHQRTAG